ncbi:hypothetical protein DICPUDRAFT_149944 [Dictyostelium purpureum]|uniref:Large ribosomal subunit protein uL4m n=1 Tax=Dictyostelium purpureum TaxID=5786 RepID=F0ZF24_DICPU|nr:uncharacterized protein DICPUDRAFT_149944 [Dictyostelium purpureum]EGC37447.1 hypothetical protein DICPUDRAFT_149944 [Dictyostelium purpureum]|eukprot:XP_003286011.1 hypothetical protein DICPUDRAFT_149944 [Dictyostelium purpureum]
MISNLCKSFNKINISTSTSLIQSSRIIGFNKINYTTSTNELLKEEIEFPIIDFDSKSNVGTIQLSKDIFSRPLRIDLLHRMVRYQRAKSQQGTHQALNMERKTSSNKKPFKQKGTGRARQGTNHAVQMKGGARAFPPTSRSHAHDLPKKVRQLCLKVALSSKLAQNKLIIIDEFKLSSHKTKDLVSKLPQEWGRSLLVDKDISENLNRSSLNVQKIDTLPERGLNVYSILQNDTLVLTRSSIEALQSRLLKSSSSDEN